jgi:hypothetical protein
MRLTFIVAIGTVILAAVAIWGLTTTIMIIAPQPKEANAAPCIGFNRRDADDEGREEPSG